MHLLRSLTTLMVTSLTFALFPASADEADIRFGVNVSPPFHIPELMQSRLNNHQGFCDELIDSVRQHLPNSTITTRQLPSARITNLMQQKRNMCFPCLIKNSAYNSEVYYSKTINLYAPHGIITRRDIADKLISQYGSPISLEQVAADTSLRFAQPKGRKYGDVQPIIEEYLSGSSHHREIFGHNAVGNLFAMILKGRVDYTLDYQMMVTLHRQSKGPSDQAELAFIPIEEYHGRTIPGAVGCARNAWGKNAVAKINSSIEAIRSDPDFQQSLDYWLGDDRPHLPSSEQ